MEILSGIINRRYLKKDPPAFILVLPHGMSVYAQGEVLKNHPMFKTGLEVMLMGEWDHAKEVFNVERIEKQAGFTDLARIGERLGIVLTEHEWQNFKTYCAQLGLFSVELICRYFFDAAHAHSEARIEALLSQVGEDSAQKLIALCRMFENNLGARQIAEILEKAESGLDAAHGYALYYALAARAKRRGTTPQELFRQNPYCLVFLLESLNKSAAAKAADRVADYLGVAHNKKRQFRIMSLVVRVLLEHAAKGDCFVPISWLYTRIWQSEPSASYENIREAIDLLFKGGMDSIYGRIQLDARHTNDVMKETKRMLPKDEDKNHTAVYLWKVFARERDSAKMFADLMEHVPSQWPEESVLESVRAWFAERGTLPNALQEEAVKSVCTNSVTVVTGPPGTGKSTIAKAIVEAAYRVLGIHSVVLAPTALAAYRAAEQVEGVSAAATVHRYAHILYEEGDLTYDDESSREVAATLDQSNGAARWQGAPGLIVVDECSMITPSVMYHILKSAVSGTRFLLLGDPEQLPPIGPGGVFPAVIRMAEYLIAFPKASIRYVDLAQNYRSSEGVVRAVVAVREGKPLGADDDIDVLYASSEEQAVSLCVEKVRSLLQAGVSDQDMLVLAPTRTKKAGTAKLNNALRQLYQVADPIPGTRFCVGDRVIAVRNDYAEMATSRIPSRLRILRPKNRENVYNGYRGQITRYENGIVYIKYFLPDEEFPYLPEELEYYVEPAYAITVHKAQGGQAKHVVLVLMTALKQRALIYTALTRCMEGGTITIIADPEFAKAPYAEENTKENGQEEGESISRQEKCLSKFYWRMYDNLPLLD